MRARDCDLEKLDTATKYPSIQTYHARGDRGQLTEVVAVLFEDEDLVITEKIDGASARIVLFPDGDYLIGSRATFLYARGDLCSNATGGIVAAIKPLMEKGPWGFSPGSVYVLYGEVYGGTDKTGRRYTWNGNVGFRVFDVATFSYTTLTGILALEQAEISRWRKNGGQSFLQSRAATVVADSLELTMVPPLCPRAVPTSLEDTSRWMHELCPTSAAVLDHGLRGGAEGLVVRTPDRSKIAKLKFADYPVPL